MCGLMMLFETRILLWNHGSKASSASRSLLPSPSSLLSASRRLDVPGLPAARFFGLSGLPGRFAGSVPYAKTGSFTCAILRSWIGPRPPFFFLINR